MIRFRKKAQKKTTPAEITDVIAHKKTMLPIYRKNHIKSFISRSPDLSIRHPQHLPKIFSVVYSCGLAITVTGSFRTLTGFPFHRSFFELIFYGLIANYMNIVFYFLIYCFYCQYKDIL